MAGAAEKLNFKLYLILIYLNVSGHMWLVSADLDSQADGWSWACWSVEWADAHAVLAGSSPPPW